MTKIADIYINRIGRLKVNFIPLDIYEILRNELGFRYTKINNKGYFLKDTRGIYEIVSFYQLNDSFVEYLITEFKNLPVAEEIEFENFLNEFYKQGPIKKSNIAREFLSRNFELSEYNLNHLLQKIV